MRTPGDDHGKHNGCNAAPAEPRRRPFGAGDRDALVAQLSDPRVARWLAAIRQPFDATEAEAFLAFASDSDQQIFALEADNALIGGLSVGDVLWYWLSPAYWGQGLMTRTLATALAERFRVPAPPLIATCREDNTASLRVLTRIGFSPRPAPRRMFFHAAGSSFACRDYVLTPEQWHFLNPPRLSLPDTALVLRPARQSDLATVQDVSAGAPQDGPWPGTAPAEVRRFLEAYRFRGQGPALWIVEDDARCAQGLVLGDADAAHLHMRAACPQRAEGLQSAVRKALERQAPAQCRPTPEAPC